MSLEGNLTSFGLSEIIQLIAVQQKTGMLSVTRQSSSMKIFFREGRIISTRDRRKGAADPLKEYLTRYGIISREGAARLTELSAGSKLDITDVILSEGLLTEEELQRHCRNHIQETVYDILTWEQCSYKFIAGPQVTDGVRVLADMAVEGCLMESMRWIDEFPLMLEEFPHGEMTVRRKPGALAEDALSRVETAVFEMITGERTIDDLIAHSKVPRFETFETLRQLKERGLIDVEDHAPPEPDRDEVQTVPARRRARRRKNPVPLVTAIVVFIACGVWGARDILPFRHQNAGGAEGRNARASVLSAERGRIGEGLQWCLEVYKAKYGSYPEDLSILKDAKIGPDSFFQRVSEHSFRYHLTPGGDAYILL